ncbi:MAG: glycosyltransferase family 39 protein [Chloroflexi bacterium]|nr:glycosyltransferase family 39 protein [Chloroflexota bacterium]
MNKSFFKSDLFILILLASAKLILHLLTNHNYGFHRDELANLHDARNLAWGFVAYPPLAPFFGSIELALFGTSLVGYRFFSALATSIVMVIAGLIAKELGGARRAQIFAALGAGIGILCLIQGALFQYVAFDYLWVVLLAYFIIRLLKSDDPRWWLAIGTTIGLGMMTRYTMGVYVLSLVIATLITPARKYLKSPWLWAGAALAFLIFLPNLIWQVQHDFISLGYQSAIHERDVRIGRADGYLPEQLLISNPFMLPFWIAGLLYYFRDSKYRMIGFMYLFPVTIFLILQGRGYYPAPAYAMLVAAGMFVFDRWLTALDSKPALRYLTLGWAAILLGLIVGGILVLPIAPVNSAVWNLNREVHDDFTEQIGWRDLTEQVAEVYHTLPSDEQARAAVFAGNYGEAGAVELYGTEYGLTQILSPVDSFWMKGAPSEKIDVLIVVGYSKDIVLSYFNSCELAGAVSNSYGVMNDEAELRDIFLCKGLRQPWAEMWDGMRRFQ